MISNRNIIDIFNQFVPKSKLIHMELIHQIVENNFPLTKEDWLPNPSEIKRHSHYPSWKRKVQAALHTLKLKNRIKHFENTKEYIF